VLRVTRIIKLAKKNKDL